MTTTDNDILEEALALVRGNAFYFQQPDVVAGKSIVRDRYGCRYNGQLFTDDCTYSLGEQIARAIKENQS
ncbi:MAG: hypothetical protein AMS21_01760 [Gemmatimonas sp. SG8_38_2]|nr:MAG: hypothetical protein AMS21_01760 [Gemmatimonas sp. SG8_38_2]